MSKQDPRPELPTQQQCHREASEALDKSAKEKKQAEPAHGTCKLYRGSDVLVITTPAGSPRRLKNGTLSREPRHISVYLVEDARPDPAVAFPAFRLHKLTGNRETWTIHVDRHGASCDCYNQGRREQDRNPMPCKHILAARSAKLIP